jgi:hypothetical protein
LFFISWSFSGVLKDESRNKGYYLSFDKDFFLPLSLIRLTLSPNDLKEVKGYDKGLYLNKLAHL